ncbi:signal peptidase II [Candidatus Pelagibacter sp.]|nr:signal peptidase II [Candidatus Pelagibacter sp.]
MAAKDIHVLIKVKVYKFLVNSLFVLILFCIDRFSKIYVIELAEKTDITEVYLTSFLNSYLVWNTGIAFGLFSLSNELTYNLFTTLIVLINLIIIYLVTITKDFRKYFFLLILGGSFGNLFDRLYFGSVPDFIDFHIGNFHWFIFNIADIFITVGVICLILAELLYKKEDKHV